MGDRGAGKTCLMTAMLYYDYTLGNKVICNYNVEFPHKYMKFEDVAKLPKELNRSTIGLDELGVGADSRQFFSKRNSKIGLLITQIRKRNCLMYYTVQRLNLIDKRIRQQTDILMLLEKTATPGRSILRVVDGFNEDIICKTMFNGQPMFNMYDTKQIINVEEEEEDILC